MQTFHINVPDDQGKTRLDKFLSEQLPEFSRSRIQSLIAGGHVSVGGRKVVDSNAKVKPSECYTVVIPPPEPTGMRPANIALDIVYEDDDLLVINKQAGLTTHPGAGNHQDTLANALVAHCGASLSGIGGVSRPGIVHRLDKDTSGLMVVAKHDKAHIDLSEQIQSRELKRAYHAIVWGIVSPRKGVIDANIARSNKNRKKMAVFRSGGKTARTHYTVLETYGENACLVECRLETGRTHQIRVHMTHLKHPLVGDQTYGNPNRKGTAKMPKTVQSTIQGFKRQALHSFFISFRHPVSGKTLEFQREMPADMQALKKALTALQ
ncbi:MAG: RluA family pseudouridine synthase [Proteobacteria bacterium]|nr:RluA family pseudouridine synthase [Pseudomonadota bacterium]